MLPTMVLISGQVDALEIYRRVATELGLPSEFHKIEGRQEKKGLTVIRPGLVDEKVAVGESRHDFAVWVPAFGSELRWDAKTWPDFFTELYPLETPAVLVYMQRTWFDEDTQGHAAAVEAIAKYCESHGATYWWTSMFDGFGWEMSEPLWLNSLEKINLLKNGAEA